MSKRSKAFEKREDSGSSRQPAPKSRAKYQCPAELEKYINWINLIPRTAFLPEWSTVFEQRVRFYLNKLGLDFYSDRDSIYQCFNESVDICLRDIPIDARRILSEVRELYIPVRVKFPGVHVDFAGHSWYMGFEIIDRTLVGIAHYFEDVREGRDTSGNVAYHSNPVLWFLPTLETQITIVNRSRLHIEAFGLSKVLEGVEGDRLRLCGICRKLFWAKRTGSKACSKSCSNTLRQRQFRALASDEKARRNAARSNNRRVKKTIEFNRLRNKYKGD